MKKLVSLFTIVFALNTYSQEAPAMDWGNNVEPERRSANNRIYTPLTSGYFKQRLPEGEQLLDENKNPVIGVKVYSEIKALDDRFVLLMQSSMHFEVYDLNERKIVSPQVYKKFEYHSHLKEGRNYIVSNGVTDQVLDGNLKPAINSDWSANFAISLTNGNSAVIVKDQSKQTDKFSLWSTVTNQKVSSDYLEISSPYMYGMPIATKNYAQRTVLNYEGKELIPNGFQKIEEAQDHFVIKDAGKFAIYDKTGKIIIPLKYGDYRICRSGVKKNYSFMMVNGDSIYVYNEVGKLHSVVIGEIADSRPQMTGEILWINANGKKSWIHLPTLKHIQIPFDKTIAVSTAKIGEKPLLLLQKNANYGVVDDQGNIVENFNYTTIEPVRNSSQKIQSYLLKDKNGKTVTFDIFKL